MAIFSTIKTSGDYLRKIFRQDAGARKNIAAAQRYFSSHGAIKFQVEKLPNGSLAARSSNFRSNQIVTFGKDIVELDANIKDAIMTSFDVPAIYQDQLRVHAANEQVREYATA